MTSRRGKYASAGCGPTPKARTSKPPSPATSVCASRPARCTRQSPAPISNVASSPPSRCQDSPEPERTKKISSSLSEWRGVERRPDAMRIRFMLIRSLPAARASCVQVLPIVPASSYSLSTSSQWTMCSDIGATLCHGHHLNLVRQATPLERLFCPVGAIALGPDPFLALAEELPDLREQVLRCRAFALERFDALQPVNDRPRLVHATNVAGKPARVCAETVSTMRPR